MCALRFSARRSTAGFPPPQLHGARVPFLLPRTEAGGSIKFRPGDGVTSWLRVRGRRARRERALMLAREPRISGTTATSTLTDSTGQSEPARPRATPARPREGGSSPSSSAAAAPCSHRRAFHAHLTWAAMKKSGRCSAESGPQLSDRTALGDPRGWTVFEIPSTPDILGNRGTQLPPRQSAASFPGRHH